MATRRQAREQALQALYSIEIGNRLPEEAVGEIVGEKNSGEHLEFVRDLVFGTLAYRDDANAALGPLLEGWSIERLPTIDRLLLQMATFELRCRPQTPPAVAINEAVELAKRFSTEDSGRFVNGVLTAVTHAEV